MHENKQNNMLKRWIAGIILVPTIIFAIMFSTFLLQIIVMLVALGMLVEWYDMTHKNMSFLLAGIPIIAIPMSCLIIITMIIGNYHYIYLTYAGIIWTVDTLAMFGGRKFGGPKLSPVLSPNKTWSGLICGMIGAAIIVTLISLIPGYSFPYNGLQLVVFAMGFAIVAQMSDLFISFFKRKFNIKDTGSIIPGHGGILDRCDSMILTAPIILYVVL